MSAITYRQVETRDLTLDMWVASRIRILRKERGWTQTQLAGRYGCTAMAISQFETMPRGGSMTLVTLQKLASVFGVSPRELLPP